MNLPRLLIIDANILFSFFKSDSIRKTLIEQLLNLDCKLISPDFVFEELFRDKERIKRYSIIDESEFIFLFSLLKQEIKVFSSSMYNECLLKAKEISPHKKDIPYFALALASNTAIWSDETLFRKQEKIKVFTTEELFNLLDS